MLRSELSCWGFLGLRLQKMTSGYISGHIIGHMGVLRRFGLGGGEDGEAEQEEGEHKDEKR